MPNKPTALERFFKTHRASCTVHIYSGDRHCSCGRDDALKEIERLQKLDTVLQENTRKKELLEKLHRGEVESVEIEL